MKSTNNEIIISTGMAGEKCIDMGKNTAVTVVTQHNDLAALVEKKLSVLSAPLSPTITTASTEDNTISDGEETVVSFESSDDMADELSPPANVEATRTTSSPEIAKTPSNAEEVSEDWIHMPLPALEGEASIIPATREDSSTIAPAKQNSDEPDESNQVSISDMQELRRLEQENAAEQSSSEVIDPMKMLRKGAVAAVGGTMVVAGLIMIPLPITPFGAVVASSGMAVLGTEFDGAREMNDKMIITAKTHWQMTREKMIQGIEEMEGKRPTVIEGTAEGAENEASQVPGVSPTNNEPLPIMNLAEQKRQEELAKQRSKANKPDLFKQLKQSTGAYLSRHLLPILKRSKEESDMGSVPDADITVQSETETLSEIDQMEYLGEEQKCIEAAEAPVESNKPKRAILAKSVSSLSDDDEGTDSTKTPAAAVSM